jgi:hypothetical protein
MSKTLHHIVIVGGGAGGLELATQLGERFGRKRKQNYPNRPKSHAYMEASPTRNCRWLAKSSRRTNQLFCSRRKT